MNALQTLGKWHLSSFKRRCDSDRLFLTSQVGVLKYRDYDASLVVREGGVIQHTDASDFHADLLQLVHMLRVGSVDGVLLDKYTLAYAKGFLQWKRSLEEEEEEGEEEEGEPQIRV